MKRILAILGLGLAGVFSGVLTWGLFKVFEVIGFGLSVFFLPGLVFGIVVGYFLLRFKKRFNFSNFLVFVVLSSLSYFAAVNVFSVANFYLIFSLSLKIEAYTLLLLSALGGTLALIANYNLLVEKLSLKTNAILLFLGTLLSLCDYITLPYFPISLEETDQISLWVFWHAGMAMGFGWATSKLPNAKLKKRS